MVVFNSSVCREAYSCNNAKMKFLILSAILACAVAAPLYVAHEVHVPLSSKTTITKSSLAVNHGDHIVASIPVVQSIPVVHNVPVVHTAPVHILHAEPKKTTVTKSALSVNHGSTHVIHSVPVLHSAPVHILHAEPKKTTVTKSNLSINHGSTHLVHSVPVVHSTPVFVHAPVKTVVAPVVHTEPIHVVHSAPVVGRIGDTAISHHSSTVHKTEPISLIAVHH